MNNTTQAMIRTFFVLSALICCALACAVTVSTPVSSAHFLIRGQLLYSAVFNVTVDADCPNPSCVTWSATGCTWFSNQPNPITFPVGVVSPILHRTTTGDCTFCAGTSCATVSSYPSTTNPGNGYNTGSAC